ncbi:MAG: hypothetical protein J0H75_11640, partial [Rhizobiales bacterium]|nr:hypothetical protein [Hyphomicrobiales bacterium]
FVKRHHYISFVDKHTTPPELGLSGELCYCLRGGVVHRAGMASHPDFGATHVIFSVSKDSGAHALAIQFDGKRAAMFSLHLFCQAMKGAAQKWYEEHESDPLVIKNMKNLIRFSPDGVRPFMAGLPVVASGE